MSQIVADASLRRKDAGSSVDNRLLLHGRGKETMGLELSLCCRRNSFRWAAGTFANDEF